MQPIEICTHAWNAALAVHRQRRREAALVGDPPRAAVDAEAAGAEPVAEVRDRAGPERDVDVRIEREEPLALRLRVAAADGDDRVGLLRASARPRCPCMPRTSCRASRGSCTC